MSPRFCAVAFSPILAARLDWWASDADLMGGLPIAVCTEDQTCDKALRAHGFGTGIVVQPMMKNSGPKRDPVMITKDRGTTFAQLMKRVPQMVTEANMPANEQGFFGSIPLKVCTKEWS